MYIMKPEDAFHVLDFMKGNAAKYVYAELQDALVSCGVLWFKPDPWTPGKQWPQYDFMAFRWPQWAADYLDSGVQGKGYKAVTYGKEPSGMTIITGWRTIAQTFGVTQAFAR